MKPKARKDIPSLLKESDEVELPMDPGYYKKLHDKIMAKVEDKMTPQKLRRAFNASRSISKLNIL